ncbi:MAG: methyltransferase domain-containing protein [Anaerolineales bacterium]
MNVERARHLRDGVQRVYSAAAQQPQAKHPIKVGRQFAEALGYLPEVLDALPSLSAEAFAGVSNVHAFAEIPVGATVLDLGCGAGTDALIAARRVGPAGRVVGVDFSEAMLARARQAASEAGVTNADFRYGEAEDLPIADGTIDVALANGIFNLNPAREAIFRELARVVRSGGVVYAAELILREPLSREVQENEPNWFA